MSEIIAWMQSNWYELGGLFVQCTFLLAGVWFARKILKTMRASQEQVGALLRLSVTDTSPERPRSSESPYWLTPSETPAAGLPETAESGPAAVTPAGRSIAQWLQTPMGGSGKVAPWRRVIRWLQAPAGN